MSQSGRYRLEIEELSFSFTIDGEKLITIYGSRSSFTHDFNGGALTGRHNFMGCDTEICRGMNWLLP